MATVKRDKTGEITHLRVGTKFIKKDLAEKILWGTISDNQIDKFLKNHSAHGIRRLVSMLLNDDTGVWKTRTKIFKSDE